MPRLPRLTAQEAEDSHRIYIKGNRRVVVPFHSGDTLHPKIIKQIVSAMEG